MTGHLIRNLSILIVAIIVIVLGLVFFYLQNNFKPDDGVIIPGSITCDTYSYSDWSACVSGKQTRTITSASPRGCLGNSAVLSQICSGGALPGPTPQPIPTPVPPPNTGSSIKLPINFYCYSFEAEPELNCTKTESQIKTALVEVNRIWAQAGIEWVFNSFTNKTLSSNNFSLTGSETVSQATAKLVNAAPKISSTEKVWNVVFIRNMPPPINGAGVTLSGAHTVYYAETKISNNETINTQYYVIAHELGHSLTLDHNCEKDNLMGPGAITASLPFLNASQIAAVKTQALKGPANKEDMPTTYTKCKVGGQNI